MGAGTLIILNTFLNFMLDSMASLKVECKGKI